MFVASAGRNLATTITGSLPRPIWFDGNLDGRTFLDAFNASNAYREQYGDAITALIGDQTRAGLDIVSDGEMRFDMDIGGRSWFGYLFDRIEGLTTDSASAGAAAGPPRNSAFADRAQTRGDIINEFVSTLRPPRVTGPIGSGSLQYAAIFRLARERTGKPVKMGTCCGQMIDRQVKAGYYKDRLEQLMAFAQAMNTEYHRLADAGCPVIQIEEPCLHGSGGKSGEIPLDTYVEAFNLEVKGLRDKTEIWCHTCWGNPFAQSLSERPSYRPVLDHLAQLDVDVLTVEATENRGEELAEIAQIIAADKKLCIGVVSHRTLQIETPSEIAALIRKAVKHIKPERLILSSDCGFGRQGMSRTHAYYKMVAMVRGANMVRHELGLPQAPIPGMDGSFGT